MPWADPIIVNAAMQGSYPGTMTTRNVTGYLPALRKGRGVSSKFLDYQLTDGDPISDEETVWSGHRLNELTIQYEEARTYRGLDVNRFEPDLSKGTTDVEKEAEQKAGQMPMANMENMVYAVEGAPVIMSQPNFYATEQEMLSQSSNIERGSPSQVGVKLYRTRDGYHGASRALAEPEQITDATWENHANDYAGYLHVEPATGVALEGAIVNMLSTFTWNCNPLKDSTCTFKATAYNASSLMCYGDGVKMMPCGATNVFTPLVMGGKVLPVYWLRNRPEAPDYVGDRLRYGVDVRYALSILVIIVPCLAFIGLVVSLVFIFKALQTHVPVTGQDIDKK